MCPQVLPGERGGKGFLLLCWPSLLRTHDSWFSLLSSPSAYSTIVSHCVIPGFCFFFETGSSIAQAGFKLCNQGWHWILVPPVSTFQVLTREAGHHSHRQGISKLNWAGRQWEEVRCLHLQTWASEGSLVWLTFMSSAPRIVWWVGFLFLCLF